MALPAFGLPPVPGLCRANSKRPMRGRTHRSPPCPSCRAVVGGPRTPYGAGLTTRHSAGPHSPSWTAARWDRRTSYACAAPLDRSLFADPAGVLAGAENNVLYARHTAARKFESIALRSVEQAVYDPFKRSPRNSHLSRFPEFGYFTLPQELLLGFEHHAGRRESRRSRAGYGQKSACHFRGRDRPSRNHSALTYT